MRFLAAALLALALLPATASAKEGIELSSLPNFLSAGQPWDVDIGTIPGDRALPDRAKVAIEITNQRSGRVLRFDARTLGAGRYHARVVFPTAGRWAYTVSGLGHYPQQNWAPVDVARADPPAASSTGSGSGGSFPWGWVAGGAAAAALALGTLGLRMRRVV
jgi:hypothetical protein